MKLTLILFLLSAGLNVRAAEGDTGWSASGYLKQFAFDTTTDGGKSILSIVLTAKAANKKILARGTGQCEVYSVVESWDWGYIVD